MEDNEKRYQYSTDEFREVRRQVERMTSELGDMKMRVGALPELEEQFRSLDKQMRDIQGEMNGLKNSVDKVLEVLGGSDLYPEGVVRQMSKTKDMVEDIKGKFIDLERKIDKKNLYINLLWGFASIVIAMLLKTVWDYITIAKKP